MWIWRSRKMRCAMPQNLSASPSPAKDQRGLWILSFILLSLVSVYFRLYPVIEAPKMISEFKAKAILRENLKKIASRSLESRLTGESPARREEIERSLLRRLTEEGDDKLTAASRSIAQRIFSDKKNIVPPFYLMEADPFYYLSLTEKILKEGSYASQTRGREFLNPLSLAPEGSWYPRDLHPAAGAVFYKTVSFFSKKITVMQAAAAYPLFLSILILGAFFFFARKILPAGLLGITCGALYLTLCPIFLRRSLLGWYDTDSYNILFPLVTILAICGALRSLSKRQSLLWMGLAVLSMISNCLFWRGWLLTHSFLGLTAAATLIFYSKKTPLGWKSLLLYLISPFIFCFLFWGPAELLNIFKESSRLVGEFFSPRFSFWPDVFLTVGELRNSSIGFISRSLGGSVFWTLSGAGYAMEILKKRNPGENRAGVFFLMFFYILTLILGIKIERFILLAAVPASLGICFAFQNLPAYLKDLLLAKLKKPEAVRGRWLSLILTVLFVSFVSALAVRTHQEIRKEIPIYNASWEKILSAIKKETPQDAIITTWWSPGHFITSRAERRVTFDGSTQNTPQAYWVANLFMEPSEEKALSILRMLDLSGNRAFDFLETRGFSGSRAIGLLHQILPLGREQAKIWLTSKLGGNDIQTLLDLTHGNGAPPPSYIFVYDDMIRQAMALEYIGKRDFEKTEKFIQMLRTNPEKFPKKILDRNNKAHILMTWALAQGPYAQDGEASLKNVSGETLYFSNSLSLNTKNLDAEIFSDKFGFGKPKSVYYWKNGQMRTKEFPDSTLPVSALVIEENGSFRSILADPRLLNSLAFRLFYLKGRGLERFELVASEESLENGVKLYVFKVLWGPEKN